MEILGEVVAWWHDLFRERDFGERGEEVAADFLERQGLTIVARGQRDRLGELDLVAVDGRTLVFVEVKSRRGLQAGRPEEAVDLGKQRKLTRLAQGFLRRNQLQNAAVRFDVVAIVWPEEAPAPHIEHFPAAFEAVE